VAFLWAPAAVVWGLIAGSYGAAALGCALALARRHGLSCALALAGTFPVVHFSYGWGFLRGAWRAVVAPGRHWGNPTAVPLSR
jgi:hypothetical protein